MVRQNAQGRRAERRHLTALFSDLSDSTALASAVDPEDFAELLDQLNQTFERTINRHGGTVLQVRGDGVFAVFGFEAREDEGRRATEAALELHEAVRNLSFHAPLPGFSGLTMHSGIHSSLVLAVEGDELLGRYFLVGDAANLASRLSDIAGRDEILVSEESLGQERYFFRTGPSRKLSFEGIENPLTVHPVVGHSAVNTRFEARTSSRRTPMIGRERELNTLQQAYERATQSQAQLVSVVAPPGTGKTRLIEEFLSELAKRDCRILRGHCESYLNAEPLQPVLQLLRQALELPTSLEADVSLHSLLVDRLSALAPRLAAHAATFEALLAPSAHTPYPPEDVVARATSELAAQLAADRPLVLFVDDWQWADDATRAALRNTPVLADIKLLVILASRRLSPGNRATSIIELQPLDTPHSVAMIEALIPSADRVVVQQVRQASGGNPLYIEELCHAAVQGASPSSRESWQPAQIPNHLNRLVVSRLAKLSASSLELLKRIAVMGNPVPAWLAADAVATADAEAALANLETMDLVYPGKEEGELRFKHGITRDVVLDSLSRDERQSLHLEVAHTIERHHEERHREVVPEMLAYHYAETSEHAHAADHAETAGDKALAAGAMDRARLQYQAALRALDRLDPAQCYDRWMQISQRLGMACLFDAEPEQCAIYERAIQLAQERQDLSNETQAEYWLAYINYALGEASEAMAHVDRAQQLVSGLDNEPLRTQILATSGQIRANACEYDAALHDLNAALALQAPFKHKPRVAYAYAYSLAAKGMILGDQGDFEAADACLDEAEQLTRGPIHPTQGSIASMRTGVYLWQGRWEDALEWARRNIDIGDRMGSRYISAVGNALAGYARWRINPDSDLDSITRALAWVETNQQTIWTSLHFSWLSEMLAEGGQYREARRAAAWVVKRARKLERLGESVAFCALAVMPTAELAAPAERYFERARRSADLRRSRRELTLIDYKQALFLEREGRAAEAARVLQGAREAFSTMGMYTYAAEAQRLELRLARS